MSVLCTLSRAGGMFCGHVFMKIQEQQPSASIPIHKVQKRSPEAVDRNPCHCFQRERYLSPPSCQSKGPTLLLESTVEDTLALVSVPSQMMSSCSVLATLSCSFGQEGQPGGGCPELLLQDLIHIPTCFPKPASLCTAKTLLLSFNLPLLLTKTRG